MTPRHRVSRAAIALIKRFEGYRQKAAQLPDERWTIGYGHTLTARQGAEVSPDDAEALLIYDLIAVTHALNEQLFVQLNQNQFDALTSFAFNVGLDNFRSSGVLKRLNEGALVQAAWIGAPSFSRLSTPERRKLSRPMLKVNAASASNWFWVSGA